MELTLSWFITPFFISFHFITKLWSSFDMDLKILKNSDLIYSIGLFRIETFIEKSWTVSSRYFIYNM